MPTGVDTSPEQVAEFRAHYLYSGNASESARKVGIPERTGRDLAQSLIDDPDFAADRRRLRDTSLQELVAMRGRVARRALRRFEAKAPAAIITATGAVVPQDKRADFGKLVLEAEKNAHALAKVESGGNDERPGTTEVHIHLAADDDDGGEKN
jgi:phage terminase small subunit